MDDTSGTAMADATGHGHTGTYYGGVTLAFPSVLPAGSGTAVNFDGSTGYAEVPASTAFNATYSWKLDAWAEVSGGSGTTRAVVSSTGTGYSGFTLEASASNTWTLIVGTGASWVTITGPAVVTGFPTYLGINRFYQSGTGEVAQLVVGGWTSGAVYVGSPPANTANPLFLGATSTSAGFFPGSIDEVAMYPNYPNGTVPYDYQLGFTTGTPTLPNELTCGNTAENIAPCQVVNPENGDFAPSYTDLSIPGRGFNLQVARAYNSTEAGVNSAFGFGWSSPYSMHLVPGSEETTISQADGSLAYFFLLNGSWVAATRLLGTLSYNATTATWTYTETANQIYKFNSAGQLISETDPTGNTTTLSYTSGQLHTVTDQAGRALTFTWGTNGKVSSITDPLGRVVSYGYDSTYDLTSVTDQAGQTTSYGYDTSHNLTSVTDPLGRATTVTYDTSDRATSVADGLGDTTGYSYAGSPGSLTTQVTDPDSHITRDVYLAGDLQNQTKAYGTSLAQTWTLGYDSITNSLLTVTDPASHTTQHT
jgi:YD repeat-containing protein